MNIIDLTFLRGFTKNDPERMKKYIGMFLQHAPVMMQNIEKAYIEKNWSALKSSAHSLKPQITYMGIKSGEDLIRTIENNGAASIEHGTNELISQLKSILDEAYPELKKEIGG
ncbi:MAG: Hpt domain-containing protein [Bacteroidia bacterium]|nr:Hpt domain-containing protein [Bacteroidia bacterium]